MTNDPSTETAPTPQIALVGTTRAGKSVFTTALAKYLEEKRNGVWICPKGGRPKSTYAQIEEWFSVLQGGNWLPATSPGTLIELQWELRVHDKKIPLRMFDYAGENLTDLFSGKTDDAAGAAKEFFDKVRAVFDSASVLLVLINLESFIEKDVATAGENKGTLVTAMSTFLENLKQDGRSCRVCFVFTAYDRYESLIRSKWGSVKDFLKKEIPPLYNEFVDENSNVGVLPVAAVGETEARVDPHDGKTILYPKPGFHSTGFDPLVEWLVEAVGDAKVELDAKAAEAAQDEQNTKFVEQLAQKLKGVSGVSQLDPIDRFLDVAHQGFPYPQRPSAAHLESRRLAFVNKANDLKAAIGGNISAAQTESRRKFFKNAAWIVVCLVVGVFGLVLIGGLIGNLGEIYEKEDCTACAASGKVACGACQGRGKHSVSCSGCGGDGRIGERWDDGIWESQCPHCSGRGTTTESCSACGGAGSTGCSTCQGTGKVYKHRAGK